MRFRNIFSRKLNTPHALRLGRLAEWLAARELKRQGYHVLVNNYRDAGGELDLIALDGQTVVFVEVKARLTTKYGSAAEAVSKRKSERIRRIAQAFLVRHGLCDRPVRFDVATVSACGFRPKIEIIRNAF